MKMIAEVIVSNASGLYRYALGDVILADHREGSELLFDLLYRRSNELCLAKGAGVITPDAIDETVSELITGKNLPAGDYCYGLSEDEDCLELYLEQAGYGEEQLTAFDVKSIASDFDNRLRIRSTIYDAARNGSFNACRVFYLEAETQAAFRETCVMRSHLTPRSDETGTPPGQSGETQVLYNVCYRLSENGKQCAKKHIAKADRRDQEK